MLVCYDYAYLYECMWIRVSAREAKAKLEIYYTNWNEGGYLKMEGHYSTLMYGGGSCFEQVWKSDLEIGEEYFMPYNANSILHPSSKPISL